MHKKTGKREYAFLFVVLICWLIYQDNKELLEILIWPFISFIAASAGLHIYDKNSAASNTPTDNFMQRNRHSRIEEFDK